MTYHCCVYGEKLLMMDRGSLKHVEFYSKNKFEKLVHPVGFIIRFSDVCMGFNGWSRKYSVIKY